MHQNSFDDFKFEKNIDSKVLPNAKKALTVVFLSSVFSLVLVAAVGIAVPIIYLLSMFLEGV